MIDVTPIGATLGARVTGIDLSAEHDESVWDRIRRAFAEHLVLVFPGQSLAPREQIAFTARLGPVEPHPLRTHRNRDYPELLVLENRPGRPGRRNDVWHADISFATAPPAAGVLHAITVPPGGRGDTLFCDMRAALDTLSEGLRTALRGLRAVHGAGPEVTSRNPLFAESEQVTELPPEVEHPLVRRVPGSNREALFANPHYTLRLAGMTPEESAPLLGYLYRHAVRPEFVYRHRWSAGDLVVFDNCTTMHYAAQDYDESMPRLLHRTTAGGTPPVAA